MPSGGAVMAASRRSGIVAPRRWRSVATWRSVAGDGSPGDPGARSEALSPLYETYFGFGARPARNYDDGVLMLYNAAGFALALGPTEEPIVRPSWMHFGMSLPDRGAVRALRDRLAADGVGWVEQWDDPDY